MHQSKDVTKTLQLHRQDYPWKSLRGVILETQGQKVQHSQGFSPFLLSGTYIPAKVLLLVTSVTFL